MRVSTSMMQRLAVDAMLERQSSLSMTQQQLALGKKLITPSDDPSGSTQVLRISQQGKQTEQFQVNADRATSRLQIEEGVLTSYGESLQRVRELAVQGLNDSLGVENRTAIAAEIRLRLDEMLDLANSKDGPDYIFSGFQSSTKPFVETAPGVYAYQGDQGQRNLQISPTRQIATSDTGENLFRDLNFSGGGKQNIFKTINDFILAMEANSPDGAILTDIDTALDKASTVRANIGARMNTIDAQKNINEQLDVQLKGMLSDIQDLDYTEAVGRLNLQLTGMQAAQQSFLKIQNLSLFNFL